MFDRPFRSIVLVNPPWEFAHSRFWGCRDPHIPLELLYAQALLEDAGLASTVVDALLERLCVDALTARVEALRPDLIVLTTAPGYLFWRCPPPELDIPRAACASLQRLAPVVAVGPHGSATPAYTLRTVGCDAVIRGEPEEELVNLACGRPGPATVVASIPTPSGPGFVASANLSLLPSLNYAGYPLELRSHRHHVFWGEGRGAEVEFSRGCPYGCIFCNRRFFRGRYRERALNLVLEEIRCLRSRGVDYVYFIDEVFGLGKSNMLLQALASEQLVSFGCQTRIDLWDEQRLGRLAAAGCVSVEFGIESPFPKVQASLSKGYQLGPDRILELLVYAKARIPWVQADLVDPVEADPECRHETEEWRRRAVALGVWVSDPVTLFPYPGCDLHERLIGPLDEESWIRARAW